MSVSSRSNWNLEVLVFEERVKPEYPEKNLPEQTREPTTNSTHIWRRRRDLNPAHIGGRKVRLTTALPLPPKELTPDCLLLEIAQRRISLNTIEKHLLVLAAYRVALTQLHANLRQPPGLPSCRSMQLRFIRKEKSL